jgi:hypothetical protein
VTVELLEAQFQAQLLELARMLQWRVYHTHDSRKSQHGFPDLVLVRDRLMMLELKRDTTRTTPPQRQWLAALHATGVEVYVVRPRNTDAIARLLAARDGAISSFQETVTAAARSELLDELEEELRVPG